MNEPSLPHYRDYLEREFQLRQRRNPGYSLRAFARDLDMQPSKLSEVIRGLRGISKTMAAKLAVRLKMAEQDAQAFVALVDVHQTKSSRTSELAKAKIQSLESLAQFEEINLERFKVISDWHHFAILELTETRRFQSDTKWIAKRLGLSVAQTQTAVTRLLDFGLLEKAEDGTLRQTKKNLATPSGIPSREIREHHSQILTKAEKAIFDVPIDEREYSATTLAFAQDQMDEVRDEIKKFRRRLNKIIESRPTKDRVYSLAIQFFPMDQKFKEES